MSIEKGFLNSLLRIFQAARDLLSNPEQPITVPLHQNSKRPHIPAHARFNKHWIRVADTPIHALIHRIDHPDFPENPRRGALPQSRQNRLQSGPRARRSTFIEQKFDGSGRKVTLVSR